MTTINGRVWKYGSHIDTDVIIPARYLHTSEPEELASHCLEDHDPDFSSQVKPGDIIVAGHNFGCGSSREHAPLAIKSCGVSCVIAASFARIFFRNSINIGLPIFEAPAAVTDIKDKDLLEVDLKEGIIFNKEQDKEYQTEPLPSFMLEIINSGGLIKYAERILISDG